MLIHLERTTFKITNLCTLNCKLCQAFIPYYEKKYSTSISEAQTILKTFFSIVDTVKTFTITGGEPLLNNNLTLIICEILKYLNQVKDTLCIVTNGSLLMQNDLLDILSKTNKSKVVISNYGRNLSTKLETLENDLKYRNIEYRVDHYTGNKDDKYGGWIDYRDHTLKHKSLKDIVNQSEACFWKKGKYYEINFGELHPCARSFWRMHAGVIPKETTQFIDLLDNSKSIKQKRLRLIEIEKLPYYTSCAYCNGNKDCAKRHKPAEQLIKR